MGRELQTEGFRITFNKDGIAVIQLNIAGTVASVGMNKNGHHLKISYLRLQVTISDSIQLQLM